MRVLLANKAGELVYETTRTAEELGGTGLFRFNKRYYAFQYFVHGGGAVQFGEVDLVDITNK